MFQPREQLLERYELTVNNISKGRGSIIADTDRGRVVLKEYRGSAERLEALTEVLQYLKQWDERTEQILADREGGLMVTDEEGKRYIVKTCSAGRECDTGNVREVLAAVEKLASLHSGLMEFEEPAGEIFRNPGHTFSDEAGRHNRELRYVRNYVAKKRKKNAFEELFWRNFQEYFRQAQEAAEQYETGGGKGGAEGAPVFCLCHGDFSQHNIQNCQARPCIINFEQLRRDEPVSDLAKFLRKVLEKNLWEKELGLRMIRTYESVRPLCGEERRRLYLRMAYPARFWNIANHYYNSRKAWVSQRDIDKLQRFLAVEEQRKQFLEMLYSLR